MPKIKQQKISKKDIFLEKWLNSRTSYIVLFAFIFVYLYTDDTILNLPKNLFILKLVFVFIIVILFFLWRYSKYKVYYKRKFKDKIYLIGLFFGIVIFSLIIQGVLNIPLNFLIISKSKNSPVGTFYCEITNVVLTGTDKIDFKFLDRKYSRYFNVSGYERRDVIKNHLLKLCVKKSILDTYYVESFELVKK